MDTGTYPENPWKRKSLLEQLLKRFSDAHKVECMAVPLDVPLVRRSVQQFPTGSQYEGTWDTLGMSGHGTYTFPNGVIYTGEFDDGEFHGLGELIYPSGVRVRGRWARGEVIETKLVFADGVEHEEGWKYCKMPDRRFSVEHQHGLRPAGRSYLTADQPTRDIPPGCYDTGDGFYDPDIRAVSKPDDVTSIIRSASQLEHKWITDNCRRNPLPHVGAIPALYEEWSAPTLAPQPPPADAAAAPEDAEIKSQSGAEIEIARESLIEESEDFIECACQHTPEQDKEIEHDSVVASGGSEKEETQTEMMDNETIECDECYYYDPYEPTTAKELSDATLPHETVDTETIECDECTEYEPYKGLPESQPVIVQAEVPKVVICEPCAETD
ncbi:uncharacterized protein LOC105386116 isoform X2 [Plutella xylostella]|uniref:uncharacterized protein LOC105386116 isoform X2 n=1 Tax=Plutella xylostella TaxID=51655 RepID=UPI0020327F3C|nr:uncharacterized protein LOC105386116 isoform X2 [Plutella xylostella]